METEIKVVATTAPTQQSTATTTTQHDILVNIGFDPIMKIAIDILEKFSKNQRIICTARGDNIPNAVAVANILVENMLKNNVRIQNITVDSEAPPGIGKMTSTIKIILVGI